MEVDTNEGADGENDLLMQWLADNKSLKAKQKFIEYDVSMDDLNSIDIKNDLKCNICITCIIVLFVLIIMVTQTKFELKRNNKYIHTNSHHHSNLTLTLALKIEEKREENAHTRYNKTGFDYDPDSSCYEWEYFEKHKDSLEFSVNQTMSKTEWCDIQYISAECNDLRNLLQINEMTYTAASDFSVDSYIICNIQSFDENNNTCMKGGATFNFILKNEMFYIEGNVIDLFNGSYLGIVYTGYYNHLRDYSNSDIINKSIEYNLIIRLDFTTFHGTFGCLMDGEMYTTWKTTIPKEIKLETMYTEIINIMIHPKHFINNINSLGIYQYLNFYLKDKYRINNDNFKYFPCTYHDKMENHYFWINHSIGYEYQYNAINLNSSLAHNQIFKNLFKDNKYLHHKWIHFMGKSRTLNLIHKLIEVMKTQHFIDDNPFIFTRHKSPYIREEIYYFKDIDLLVTSKNHPDLYWLHLNVSQYFNEIRDTIYRRNSPIIKYWNFTHNKIPNIHIINKGLHQAYQMPYKQQLMHYKNEIYAYFRDIIDEYKRLKVLYNDKYFEKLIIFWRQTASTLFAKKRLPVPWWACMTPTRINCLNRLSSSVLSEFIDLYKYQNDILIQKLDHYTLSLGRHDCAHDNRHYLHGNCQETMVYNMLYRLLVLFSKIHID